ncbi:SCP2 sterol-binding domain-containing protein [Luedemannella helvata]|uniref:SCP2 domain-containing protein n=1 Tax=Luedemannella helvata TaxID=349315 RepID=A0ABP4X384_9ACTN
MTDVIMEYLNELERSDDVPILRRASGTMRFDIEGENAIQRWLVTMNRGQISVKRSNAPANCVVRGDRAIIEKMINGELNPLAGMLRGLVQVELAADSEVLVLVVRYTGARVQRMRQEGLLPARPAAATRPKGRRR